MKLPRGQLVRSRVVSTPGTALESVLDRGLTGYAVLEPQDALLLDADGQGVITFEDGVPHLAYHTGTGRGGSEALADLAVPGPYSVDVFELSRDALAAAHDTPELAVAPGMPAERVAGNRDLAERTRQRAESLDLALPSASEDADRRDGDDAVAAFLGDEQKIDAIREQAREEAERRAREWGLEGELAGSADRADEADDPTSGGDAAPRSPSE
jgi:hypothetical protein